MNKPINYLSRRFKVRIMRNRLMSSLRPVSSNREITSSLNSMSKGNKHLSLIMFQKQRDSSRNSCWVKIKEQHELKLRGASQMVSYFTQRTSTDGWENRSLKAHTSSMWLIWIGSRRSILGWGRSWLIGWLMYTRDLSWSPKQSSSRWT